MSHTKNLCPCGSGLTLDACCGLYLQGTHIPPTALALMRSRYTAYHQGMSAYLLATWHPRTRPPSLSLEAEVRWIGLKILAFTQGQKEDDYGRVHFVARYKIHGKAGRMQEHSCFEKSDGRWWYVAASPACAADVNTQ
jgi:SEC-C motif domain protein